MRSTVVSSLSRISAAVAALFAPLRCVSLAALFMLTGRAVAVVTGPQTWNPTSAFSIANGNPNGVWSYGWMDTGFTTFTPYTNQASQSGASFWYGWGGDFTPSVWLNTSGSTNVGIPAGGVAIHPGNSHEPSVLRWTAPLTTAVRVAGQFLAGDTGVMQVAVRHNNTVRFSATDAGAFDFTVNVTSGDTLNFAVFGGYSFGNTGLQATISEPAANDAFAGRAAISGTSASVAGTNSSGTKESGEPSHAGNAGGASSWWTWTAPKTGLVSVSTIGSSFDTLLGVYTGAAVGSLTTIASDDNSGPSNTSKLTFNATAGTVYQIAVDGAAGAAGSITLNVGYAYHFTTVAGLAGTSGSTNATGSAARFFGPNDVVVDSSGNAYVGEANNHTLRKITAAGVVTTLAGTPGAFGTTDATGADARFKQPLGLAFDGSGNVLVADYENHAIRKVTSTGVVTTFAGLPGTSGPTNATGTAARFNFPVGLAVDSSGNVFVADAANHVIRKITSGGEVTTFAGTMGTSGSTDGTGTAAKFNNPYRIAIDASGNLVVADTFNHTLRKITPAGVVTTLAGTVGVAGVVDGAGTAAKFSKPYGVAVDPSGNVFVADYVGHTVRMVTPAGVVTTVAGVADTVGTVDGTPSTARFNAPTGVARDASGNLFIADFANHTIRKGVLAFAPEVTSVSPAVFAAGASVTITGANFTAATAVTFNGTAAASFAIVSPTQITATAPATLTAGNIVVTGPGGVGTVTAAYTVGAAGSTFAADAQGWSLFSFTDLSLHNYTPTPGGATTATFAASGGNPGGHILSNDPDGGDSTFSAPAAFLGNRTTSIGAALTYDLIHPTGALNYQAADLILVGNGVRLVWKSDPALAPAAAWINVSVPLKPSAQWRVSTTAGALATAADFQNVMGNLTGLYLRGEYTFGAETTGIDNVVLGVAVPGLPAISGISSSTVLAGATVTLTGSGFTGATAVSFNGTAATSFTVLSDLILTAVVPAGATSGNVTVTSPGGTSTTTAAFTVAVSGPMAQDRFDPNANGTIYATVVQPDGKIIIAGDFTTLTPNLSGTAITATRLARLNRDGSVDSTFTASADQSVRALALQSDGKILIGGAFGNVNSTTRNRVARLTPNGTLDTDFNPNADGNVRAIAVQSDGKILLGGSFGALQPNGAGTATTRTNFARLLTDGTLDSLAFTITTGEYGVRAVLPLPDGSILVAGDVSTVNGVSRANIFRITPAGALDAPLPATPIGLVSNLARQIDGKILLGGEFTSLGSVTDTSLVRLNADFSLDTGFSPAVGYSIRAIVPQADGKIVVGGIFTAVAGQTRQRLVRLNPNGNLDTGFVANASSDVQAIALQTDGSLVVAGDFTTLATHGRGRIARVLPDGSLERALIAEVASNGVGALAVQPDGKIILGGHFTTVAGQSRNFVARLNADSTLDTTFNPAPDASVIAPVVLPGGQFLLGGRFTTIAGQSRPGLARFQADGTFDATFNANISGGVLNGALLQPDGKIVVGGTFTSVGGQTRNRIARLNTDGTLDTAFNPDVNGEVYGLALQGDGAIVFTGDFTTVGGQVRNRIARVTAAGALDAFNPDANGHLSMVAVQADGKLLAVGTFTTMAGAARNHLARLHADGTIDSTFDPAADAPGIVQLQSDGKILVGGTFTTIAGVARNNLARLHADGSLDAAFNPLADGSINSLALQPDGKIVVGGHFANIGGQARQRLARLTATGPTSQVITASPSTVTFTRTGPLPELAWVTFEKSTDGITWSALGTATRAGTSANWQLAGQSLPGGLLYLRARGAAPTAVYGASSLVEHVQQVFLPAALAISTPPLAQTLAVGGNATFTVAANLTSGVSFQWQRQAAGTSGFVNLANGGAYAGATTSTLTVTGLTGAMAGDQFRVVVSHGVSPNVTSDPAVLSVAAGAGIVAISIPVNSHDATSRPVLDGIWSVVAPPYPLSQSGIGALVKTTFSTANDPSDFVLHDHVYSSPHIPDPARATVTMVFNTPLVVRQLEVIQHENGVTRIECFVGDSPDSLVSIGSAFGPSGDVVGTAVFPEGSSQVFQFTNTTAGRYCRFVIRKTSKTDGWALHRVFPRNAAGERILGIAASAPALPAVTAVAPATFAAGASVTLTGTGFTGASLVRFNGLAAAFTVVSDTSITATVPVGVTSGSVAVVGPGGAGTVTAAYTAVLTPVVQRLFVATGAGGASGQLFAVNPATATATLVANLTVGGNPLHLTGLAFHPQTGVLYGVTGNELDSARNRKLVTIDLATGQATIVGTLNVAGVTTGSSDIGFDPNGTLYTWRTRGGPLGTINLTNAVITPIGTATNGSGGNGLAFTPDGSLYVAGPSAGSLSKVNPLNGALTTVATLTGAPVSFDDINAMTSNAAGLLYAVSSASPATLVTINATTGAVTTVGTLPFSDADAIAFAITGPLPVPLLHRYAFDTGTVTDLVGTAHGTLVNGAAITGGRLVLDGSDDHVQFAAKLVPATGDFSVAFFAQQFSVQGGFREIISQGSSGGPGFYVGHDTARVIRVGDNWISTGQAFPNDGLMHHYAVTGDATDTKLYIDGVLVQSKGSALSITSGGDNTRLGAQYQGAGENFHGAIDEVRIYGGALTATEVAALAAAVPPMISTQPVASSTGTVGGSVTLTVAASSGATYQWRRLGVPIPGANSPTLNLTNVTMGSAGVYDVVVTASGGASAISAPAVLSVAPTGYPGTMVVDETFDVPFERELFDVSNFGINHVAVVPDSGGKFLAAGVFVRVNNSARTRLARFHADGSLDTSWMPAPINNDVHCVLVQADGKILLGGTFTRVGSVSSVGLARLNSDGSVDPTFSNASAGIVYALAVQADGRILAAGSFISVGFGTARTGVARYHTNGTVDTSFDAALGGSSVIVRAIATQRVSGVEKILIGGNFSTAGGVTRRNLARVNADGSLDTSFSADSANGGNNLVRAILSADSGGKILVGGSFTTWGGQPAPGVARLEAADGALDPAFSTAMGTGVAGSVYSLALQADGRVLVGGSFTAVNGVPRTHLARLNANGSLDGDLSASLNASVHAVVPQTAGDGGGIVLGGTFTTLNSSETKQLARLTSLGTRDPAVAHTFYRAGSVNALVHASLGGGVVVGGDFTHVNGLPAHALVQLTSTGLVDPTFNSAGSGFPKGASVSSLAAVGDGRIYALGSFSSYNGTARNSVLRLNSGGGLDTAFDPGSGPSSTPNAMLVLPGGKLLLAGFLTSFNGTARNGIVALNANGTVDGSFLNPTGSMPGNNLVLARQFDGKILIGGDFTTYAGVSVNRLVRLTADGELDSAFNTSIGTGPSHVIREIVPLPDNRIYVAGGFTSWGGSSDYRFLVRLNTGGSIDSGFQPPTNSSGSPGFGVASLLLQADGRLIERGLSGLGIPNTFGFGRLTPLGAADATFAVQSVNTVNSNDRVMLLLDNGNLFVGGNATLAYGSSLRHGLARLIPLFAPVINTHPVAQTIAAGGSVTFTVEAGGATSNTYQWFRDGNPIAGASAATLTIDKLTFAQAGHYTVTVSNAQGSVPSLPALLMVNEPATIAAAPAPTTVVLGGPLTLHVRVGGTPPFTYQWRRGGAPVAAPGANSATLTIPVSTSLDLGSYDVVVTNAFGPSATSAAVSVTASASGATWVADPTFTRPQFRITGAPGRIVATSGGKYYVSFDASGLSGLNHQRSGAVMRLNADGTLDPTFTLGASLSQAWAVAVQNDGRVLVGGFDAAEGEDSGEPVYRVFRFQADGSRDLTFRSPALGGLSRFITLQPDGRVLVAASPGAHPGSYGSTLVRLNSDGTHDATFTAPVLDSMQGGAIFAPIVVDSTGRIVIAGTFTTVNGAPRLNVARLLANGTLDSTFVPSGYTTSGTFTQVRGLALQSQGANAGKLLIAGGALTVGGVDRPALRLDATTGALDPTFVLTTQAAAGMSARPRMMQVLANDQFYLVGLSISRFHADGTADNAFVRPTFSSELFWLDVDASGRVVVPVDPTVTLAGASVPTLLRFGLTGTRDTAFDPGTFQREVFDLEFAVQGDSRLLAFGPFATVNSTARTGFARFNLDGSLDSLALSGVPNLLTIEGARVRSDGRFLARIFTGANLATGTSSFRLFEANGAVSSAFSLDPTVAAQISGVSDDSVSIRLLADDRLLAAVQSPQQVLNGSLLLKRLNTDGTLDNTFTGPGVMNLGAVYRNPGGAVTQVVAGRFSLLAHYADGRALAISSTGAYPQNAVSMDFKLVRLAADGTPDSGFVSPVLSVAARPQPSSGPLTDPSNSTTVTPSIISSDHEPVYQATLLADNRILIVGTFNALGDHATAGLARLTATGAIDPTFSVGSGPEIRHRAGRRAVISGVTVAPDGSYWVTGVFDTFNGRAAPGLVRLAADGTVDATFATDVAHRAFLTEGQTRVLFAPDGSAWLAGSYAKAGDPFPFAVTRLIVPVTPTVAIVSPLAPSVTVGGATTLSVVAIGTPAPTLQWQRNGDDIPGATNSSLVITNASQANAGTYRVVARTGFAVITSGPIEVAVITSNLVVMSSRSRVPAGGRTSGSFTIEGAQAKTVLIRGVGPALSSLEVSGFLVDPRVRVYDRNNIEVGSNNDWTTGANPAGVAPVLAAGSKDAALQLTLAPGTYHVVLDGNTAGGGIALLQVYDLERTKPRIVMLTTRGTVGVGGDTIVVGFTIDGTLAKKILFRAPGEQLTNGGSPATSGILVDPMVRVFDSAGSLVAFNDDWSAESTALIAAAAAVGAPPFNGFTRDAAMLLDLAPGHYTAELVGFASSTGESLIEIFEVDAQRAVTAPPALTWTPSNQIGVAGGSVVFSAHAIGLPVAAYQWRRNGLDLAGATNPVLHFINLQTSDAVSGGAPLVYDVVATNSAGSVTSPGRTLTLLPEFHSADSNQDRRINLFELTRVIEIYNYRVGTVRTGAYRSQPGSEDGFMPGPGAITSHHSADSNRDGTIDLNELTRVIELFNFASNNERTGEYHAEVGTEDGFASGPVFIQNFE